ncbi:MAG: phosphate/phosphite/phosphonate ABC transporter substrate-binding protein [Thermodesulfovibrionales bacterium]|nr:phosphate/phosphite/phosphonate ABC transporter substrate-binding protein [Thermodesulfovibrionales bacterium]
MREQHNGWLSLSLCIFLFAFWFVGKGETQEVIAQPKATPLARIGVVPALTITEIIKQYQPIVDYLNKRLNVNAQLMPQKDYVTVLEKMKNKEIDAAIMGSSICYRAIKEIGAIPLVRPERAGVSTYEGVVFVRSDSGIKDIYGLKGKSFVYIDRNTSAGYVYPRFLLKEKGYNADAFFKEVIFAGKHDAAVLMVLNKKADGGAAKDDVYFKLGKENPRIKNEMKILHLSSAKFPDRTIVIRKGFDSALSIKIKEALITMNKDEEGRKALKEAGFDRYLSVAAGDFGNLEKMLR